MKVIMMEGAISWKGETYLPGDEIDLPKDEAERLIDKGKVEKKAAKKPASKPEKDEKDEKDADKAGAEKSDAEKGGDGDAKD